MKAPPVHSLSPLFFKQFPGESWSHTVTVEKILFLFFNSEYLVTL